MVPKEQHNDLLARLQDGDEAAFSILFYAFKDKLYSFLLDFTKSPAIAEDMVQNTFLTIWHDRKKMKEINSLDAYIFRMAKNMAIDHMRKYARETYPLELFLQDNIAGHGLDPHHEFINKELSDKIMEAINTLPPQQKKVYLLHHEEGLKHEEIAQLLQLSPSTIRNHLMRANSSLRSALSSHMLAKTIITSLAFSSIFLR